MTRHILELNGPTWQLGRAPAGAAPLPATWDELGHVAEWLPASVPGNVRADLLRAGRVPDPFYGRQNEQVQWVDDHNWWLIRDFDRAGLPSPGARAHLVLRGVDYVSDVFLNEKHLGRHEGMFSPQVYDVTGLLAGQNRLAVRVAGSRWLPADRSTLWEKILNHVEALPAPQLARFPHRRDTVKCQMSFGWDFAPALRAMGIWDDVYLVLSDELFIQHLAASTALEGNRARLHVEIEIDAAHPRSARLACRLVGETFRGEPLTAEQPVELAAGLNRHHLELIVPEPHLWWPWDHGRPDLYRLAVEVLDAAPGGAALDSAEELIGLREVRLEGWTFHVNGRPVLARGANWVPADSLPGRVGEDDYRELLSMARQANMNMLRVWGGGLREKRPFYELCDRLGLLVWQEFPLACAFVTRYPRSADYVRLVEAEARAIVRDVRNHPSVVLWCGGNEFHPRRNAPVVDALRRAAAEDPTRPFLPASPHEGDSHNWRVWHGLQPPAAYRDDDAGFASEFGLQALPNVATLQRFIPAAEMWPPGPTWTYHRAGLDKLARYARPFQGGEASLDELVQASQRAQANGLQIGIEHYRRMKAQGCGGALVWQLNEPWPAISWSLIDYYRQPKAAYHAVKRVMSPVLVSVNYPLRPYRAGDAFCPDVWIVNDTAESLPGCELEVLLLDEAGQRANELARTVDVAPLSAEVETRFCWTLPAGQSWRLVCRLRRLGRLLSDNEYDLGVYDGLGPNWRQRLWLWLGRTFVPM